MTTFDRVYNTVVELSRQHGIEIDGWQEEITEVIIEDNGENLTPDEIRDVAEDFFAWLE
jgi:hypothetical protein